MRAPFTTKRADGRAEWDLVYELFRSADYGTLIEFPALRSALGDPEAEPHRVYAAVNRAAKSLRKFDQRSLENVRGVGYRVLQPQEHERQERVYRCRGQRQVQTALAVNRATALERLDDAGRRRAVERGCVLAAMAGVLMDHEKRLREQERLIDTVAVGTSARLDAQEQELQRLRALVEQRKAA